MCLGVAAQGPTDGVPLAPPAGPGVGGGTGKRRLSSANGGGGGASVASVRRKSNALMRLPDPVDVDLDADFFSSSQQIRRGDASTTGEGWRWTWGCLNGWAVARELEGDRGPSECPSSEIMIQALGTAELLSGCVSRVAEFDLRET